MIGYFRTIIDAEYNFAKELNLHLEDKGLKSQFIFNLRMKNYAFK